MSDKMYQQVSGGNCAMTLYMEESPGVVAKGTKGIRLAFMSEDFRKGSSKRQRSVIRGVRGPGKPYEGLAQLSGSIQSAAYAPQLGWLWKALCGVPQTTAVEAKTLSAEAVTDLGNGLVGLPCPGHGYVQDAVISVTGTTNYDGTYRVAKGVTADVIAIHAPFVAETLGVGAKVHRGRVCWLFGDAVEAGSGKVSLPVKGGSHELNVGESVTIDGSTNYDGTFTLQEGTKNGVLVIQSAYTAESFDGSEIAVPKFYEHRYALPNRQPTVCMEKFLDFEEGAAVNMYRRYNFCKVNGMSFSFGGDDELVFGFDFGVGKETADDEPLDASPSVLPAVDMDNIEASIWVAGVRRGDIQDGSYSTAFGIEPKAAVGDLGQYSRMPEGDPDCSISLTAFLETDELQRLVDASSTVDARVGICALTGEEAWFDFPETELDSEGPAISGKEGLMQTFTVMPFVDKGDTMLKLTLINRVESYAN